MYFRRPIFTNGIYSPCGYKMQAQYELLIQSLLEKDFGSVVNWFTDEEINGLRKALIENYNKDNFHPAKIGNIFNEQRIESIRKDKIHWLEPTDNNPFIVGFFEKVFNFIEYLNRTCFAGIHSSEFHFAVYEPGSFYKKHVDQFNNDDKRRFSFVLYLTEDWKEEDGGQLVIYKEEDAISIAPTAGKVVFFDSKLEHEVVVAQNIRLSVTGWLKTI